MQLTQFWSECKKRLEKDLPVHQYKMWVGRLSMIEQNEEWIVLAPTAFIMGLVKDSCFPLMLALQEEIAPGTPILKLNVGKTPVVYQNAHSEESENKPKNTQKNNVISAHLTTQKPTNFQSGEQVNSRYEATRLQKYLNFDSLVIGKGNQLAYSAALSIANDLGKKDYNPFFVYGGTGLGKTHLVQSIANKVFQQDANTKISYVHAEKYINDYIRAVRRKDWDEFKHKYQSLDLLILDDIQFIAGKEKTMEEFFYLFNRFLDDGKQIILTSDRLPADIEKMDDRLRSRFSWGLTVEIEPPELEMRVAILQKKAEASDFRLPNDTAFFIAQNIRSNVRDLEGALNRVRAHCRFIKKTPDIESVKVALKDILASGQKQITIEQIQKTVADYFQIKVAEMRGKKRSRNIARPRQIAMSLAKELTQQSLPSIGELFGGRDHTTVIHAFKTISKLRLDDAELAQDYTTLSNILKN